MMQFIQPDPGQARLISAYALDANGLVAAVSKMAFGNKLGVSIRGMSETGRSHLHRDLVIW